MDQVNYLGETTTLIHFVTSVNPERIACMPSMQEFHTTKYHPNYQRTNEVEAVSCPACQQTEAYKRVAPQTNN